MRNHFYEQLPTIYTSLGLIAGLTVDNLYGRLSAAALILLSTVIFNMRLNHRSQK